MGVSGSEGAYTAADINGDATNGLDVDVTRVIPGTSATHLGKAEDAAHGSGDTGVMILAVRRDAEAVGSGADGDYSTLNVDANGRLYVSVANTVTVGSHAVTNAGTFAVQAAQSGTWTVDLGATDNAVLDAIAASVAGTLTVGSHAVTNAGTFAVQVDGAALTALQLIDNIVLAEDAAHQTADVGVMMLAVRRDTAAVGSGADGDYSTLNVDATGRLWVHDDVLDAALSGSELQVDVVAALPAGTNNIGDVDIASITAGDNVIGRVKLSDGTDVADILDLTNSNPLTVAIVDGDGTQITSFGGGTQYTEDAAAAANPVGTALNLVRVDTPAGVASADGDNVAARGTNYGAMYVTLLDTGGTAVSVGGGTQYDEDTAHVSGDKVTMAGVVRADTAAAQSATDGDRTVLITDASGRLHVNVGNTVTVGSHAVTNAGTFVVQVDGAALTALQLIDDAIFAEDVAAQAADKGVAILAVRRDTPSSLVGADNDYINLTTDSSGRLWTHDDVLDAALAGSELQVDVVGALPAGTNAIGKLAANSGVDIGDVDVTSISAGTNTIGNVGLVGRTSGGMSIFKSIDLDESEEEIKASAGQVFSIAAFNRTAAPLYLKFYNATAANTTVGTTTPVLTFVVPANADSDGAGFIWNNTIGYAFGTAISAAVTTGVADADTGAPGANDCVVMVGYV